MGRYRAIDTIVKRSTKPKGAPSGSQETVHTKVAPQAKPRA